MDPPNISKSYSEQRNGGEHFCCNNTQPIMKLEKLLQVSILNSAQIRPMKMYAANLKSW